MFKFSLRSVFVELSSSSSSSAMASSSFHDFLEISVEAPSLYDGKVAAKSS
jgi:hypothetical protein